MTIGRFARAAALSFGAGSDIAANRMFTTLGDLPGGGDFNDARGTTDRGQLGVWKRRDRQSRVPVACTLGTPKPQPVYRPVDRRESLRSHRDQRRRSDRGRRRLRPPPARAFLLTPSPTTQVFLPAGLPLRATALGNLAWVRRWG